VLCLLLLGAALQPLAARAQSGPSADPLESALAGSLPTVTVEAERLDGLELAASGVADYALSSDDISRLPSGSQTSITDVLAQLPSVALDQNQQIHIRSTEGPQFQYQINGFLVPLDINTNPPFLSMLNTLFIRRLDLLVGVVPARYGYATGGVVDLETQDGCRAAGGEIELYGGQRETYSPSLVYGACGGAWSSFLSARATWSDTAFSSATPGPTPIHDHGRLQQALGFWTLDTSESTRVSLLLAATNSHNQLPNAPGLTPQYALEGASRAPPSTALQSRLDFRDLLAMAMAKSSFGPGLEVQLGFSAHFISQEFFPDPAGELIYQGVASQSVHEDRDQTLQGDLHYLLGRHTLGAGFYVGDYKVGNGVDSLVFPVSAAGITGAVPVRVLTGSAASNVVSSLYLSDQWRLSRRWTLDAGVRGDSLTGYTHAHELSPRFNATFRPNEGTALHAGVARFMQVPSLLGIAPSTQAAFQNTTAAGPPGTPLPVVETDLEYDAGLVQSLAAGLTVSLDGYYERTHRYLDTGQFGVVPIFAPFNYGQGHIWGTELALRYKHRDLAAYANYTVGKNWQQGVATGQFNFDPEELKYIDTHAILLDHQPVHGASAGLSYAVGSYAFSSDAIYSSGLAGGFADTQTLPETLQVNLAGERSWSLPGLKPLSLRLSVLNVADRVNEIRSANGIGIFQAAYGPRRTLYAALNMRF
jgi:hypothetical protein